MRLFTLLCFLCLSPQAMAIGVSLDLNPELAGVQNSALFDINRTFEIDVVINQLQSSSTIQSYGFDLNFNSQKIAAKQIIAGDFLSGEYGEDFDDKIKAGILNFSLFALGTASHEIQGVLAKIVFQIKEAGESQLTLNNVELADTGIPSLPIIVDTVNNATLNQVPLPPALLLFITAVITFSGLGKIRPEKLISSL